MKKILKYTDELKSLVRSNVKAQPWLHIGIVITDSTAMWAIWVWDTRVIVDYGDIPYTKSKGYMTQFAQKLRNFEPAMDNHKILLDEFGDNKRYPIELSIAFGFCKNDRTYKDKLPKKKKTGVEYCLGGKRHADNKQIGYESVTAVFDYANDNDVDGRKLRTVMERHVDDVKVNEHGPGGDYPEFIVKLSKPEQAKWFANWYRRNMWPKGTPVEEIKEELEDCAPGCLKLAGIE